MRKAQLRQIVKYIYQVRIVATDEGKIQPQAQMEKD